MSKTALINLYLTNITNSSKILNGNMIPKKTKINKISLPNRIHRNSQRFKKNKVKKLTPKVKTFPKKTIFRPKKNKRPERVERRNPHRGRGTTVAAGMPLTQASSIRSTIRRSISECG